MHRRLRQLVLSLRLRGRSRLLARLLMVLLAIPILMAAQCSELASLEEIFYLALLQGIVPITHVTFPEKDQAVVAAQAVRPGQRVAISCRFNRSTTDTPSTLTVEYWPPSGASQVTFTGRQPLNPAGPPPYRFDGVPVDTDDAVLACYDAPALVAGGAASEQMIDVFAIRAGNDTYYQVVQQTLSQTLAAPPSMAAVANETRAGEQPRAAVATTGDYYWSGSQDWLYSGANVVLTSDTCRDIADFFQGGNFFIALGFPLAQSGDQSYTVPVPIRMNNPFLTKQGYPEQGYPRVDLLDESKWPFVTLFELPLELRPEWMWYAANKLPQRPGQGWATLAPLSTPPATCASDLRLTDWEVRAFFPFDFGGTKNSCKDCVVEAYLCWSGRDEPEILDQPSGATIAEPASSSWRDVEITVAGPVPIRILGDPASPPILLEGPGLAHVVPPDQLKLSHRIRVISGTGAVSFNLSTSSAQRLGWRLYRDTGADEPDFTRPITAADTLTVTGAIIFWAVADVPLGVSGPETLTITATTAGASTSQADVVWLGGWPAQSHRVRRHLPHD